MSDEENNASNGAAESWLHEAAWAGDLDWVKKVVEEGADINWCDSAGETALFGACGWGRTEVVSYLIAKGASVILREDRKVYGDNYQRAFSEQSGPWKCRSLHRFSVDLPRLIITSDVPQPGRQPRCGHLTRIPRNEIQEESLQRQLVPELRSKLPLRLTSRGVLLCAG